MVLNRHHVPVSPASAPGERAIARRLAHVVLTLGLALGLVLSASAATAQDPFYLPSQVTDEVGVLGVDSAAEDAVTRLRTNTGTKLWIVYVDTFSGLDRLAWAEKTFAMSGMGTRDVLLAIATTDRQYTMLADPNSTLTDAQLDDASAAAEGKLAANDWAGAAIATADSLGSSSNGANSWSLLTIFIIGIVVIAVGALVVQALSRTRRSATSTTQAQGLAALPTQELTRQASAALVAVDGEIKSAEQELGFAQAQFGAEATDGFTATLDTARAKVTHAFSIRQLLDDDAPESEAQRRTMLAEIIGLCSEVSQALAADAHAFTEQRNLHNTIPQVLAETRERISTTRARVEPAHGTLAQLAVIYPPTALASIAANPNQAVQLLDAAEHSLMSGEAAVSSGDRGTAVTHSRAATAAIAQARTLLDAVDSASTNLAQAGERLDTATASISSDLADATHLAPRDPAVQAAATQARQVILDAQAARSGGDPLAAFHALVAAEASLDAALEPFRGLAEQRRRAADQVQNNLGQLDSILRGTSDFVTTRQGAVGPEARTRLSEAVRLYNQARSQSETDPIVALATAQQALSHAQSAQALAQRDVQNWEEQQRRNRGGGGGNIGGMVLGGIVLDSILRGSGGGGRGGRGSRSSGGFGSGGRGGGGRSRSRGGRF